MKEQAVMNFKNEKVELMGVLAGLLQKKRNQ